MSPLLKRLPGRGKVPAKRVKDLKAGDVIIRPMGGSAAIERIVRGIKGDWLTLYGLDWDYAITVWKRKGTLVGVAT